MEEYLRKLEKNEYANLLWNVPEQKMGTVNIVGGQAQSFRTPVRVAEYLGREYPVKEVRLVLPDALFGKLPALDNVVFLPSTESGSLNGEGLAEALNVADWNLVVGDLSKNSITARGVVGACEIAEKPLLITRDAVDLMVEAGAERTLLNDKVAILASVAQLSKLFRAVYYPKVLMMSQSLVQVADALHKFTLSYPVGVVTLHNGLILVARDGTINAVALEKTGFSPIMLWGGELAARMVALNLFNPGNWLGATTCAVFASEP